MTAIALQKIGQAGQVRALIALGGLVVLINYVDRGNIATAGPLIKDELGIDNTTFGLLVSAFFWTYAPGQLVSGWLAQKFDAGRVLAVGLVIWALATIATGLVGGFTALLLLRLVLGAGESVTFPATSKLFSDHLSPEQYGASNAATAMGLAFGPAFGVYVGGMVMAGVGWRPSFVLFGLVSLLWLVPWLRLQRDSAPIHASHEAPPSYVAILRKRELWGAAMALFCGNYAMYFMLAWLPLYLVKSHGFSMATMASMGGMIYLLQGTSAAFFGWLSDRWIRNGMSVARSRMTMLSAGLLLNAVFLLAASAENLTVAIGALFASAVCGGMSSCNVFATAQTLAGPRAAGRWVGVQNFIGNLAGICAPVITGFIVDRTGHFSVAFGLAAAMLLAGGLSVLFVVRRIAPVEWD